MFCQIGHSTVHNLEFVLVFVLDDHETLYGLLQDISLPERVCTVKNWRTGGQVIIIQNNNTCSVLLLVKISYKLFEIHTLSS